MRSAAVHAAQVLYFMAPAYVANMLPPFLAHWRGWNPPISRRWLGSHKTVLGATAGVLGAVATTFLQSLIGWPAGLSPDRGWLDLGVRFGTGAMAGDAVKSFFKRRAGIAPGQRWIPFDQVDFVVGALLLVWPVTGLSRWDVPVILVISAVGHVAVNHAGYWLGVRQTRW